MWSIYNNSGHILGFFFKLLGTMILAGAVWIVWAYSNCLWFGSDLGASSTNDIVEVVKNLYNLEEIRYAEDPFTKDKYNVFIIRGGIVNYRTVMTENDIAALEIASILFPKLKPYEKKAIHISIPIIISGALLVLLFHHRHHCHNVKNGVTH